MLEGVNLMVIGMTAVFTFLTLLVVVLQVSARVFASFGHWWPDPGPTPSRAETMPQLPRGAEIAVALAAIEFHRRRQG